mmetsp:Transcript_8698/g.25004  ORF Transcript_8698/g.25004 Transcript_8698/m.25004 type:complete len:266 (-) Transcript_8698:589-1386(-)
MRRVVSRPQQRDSRIGAFAVLLVRSQEGVGRPGRLQRLPRLHYLPTSPLDERVGARHSPQGWHDSAILPRRLRRRQDSGILQQVRHLAAVHHRRRRHASRRLRHPPRMHGTQLEHRRGGHPQDHRQRHRVDRPHLRIPKRRRVCFGKYRDRAHRGHVLHPERGWHRQADGPFCRILGCVCRLGFRRCRSGVGAGGSHRAGGSQWNLAIPSSAPEGARIRRRRCGRRGRRRSRGSFRRAGQGWQQKVQGYRPVLEDEDCRLLWRIR